ncbi:MAG: hypothetical protein AB1742_04300 [bacterium]
MKIPAQKPFSAQYACLPRRFVPRPVRRLPVRARTQTGANLSASQAGLSASQAGGTGRRRQGDRALHLSIIKTEDFMRFFVGRPACAADRHLRMPPPNLMFLTFCAGINEEYRS